MSLPTLLCALPPSSSRRSSAQSYERDGTLPGGQNEAACGLLPQGWTGYWDSPGRQELSDWLSWAPLPARPEGGGRGHWDPESCWRSKTGVGPREAAQQERLQIKVQRPPLCGPHPSSPLPLGPEVILSHLLQGLKRMSLFPFPHCDIVI